jgi:hypothetical protein
MMIATPNDTFKKIFLLIFFSYLRNTIGDAIMERITNLKDEDLIISLDADEMPKPEVFLFINLNATT